MDKDSVTRKMIGLRLLEIIKKYLNLTRIVKAAKVQTPEVLVPKGQDLSQELGIEKLFQIYFKNNGGGFSARESLIGKAPIN